MSGLLLSLFPGIDLLGRGFELEGFNVVRGPDPIFGGARTPFQRCCRHAGCGQGCLDACRPV
jgi:hypothetical protein